MKCAKVLVALVIVSVIVLSAMQMPAFGHRSGCHSWHSCPSDHGTYECGDTGHCSECPDNNYCKAGQPISLSSSGYSSNSGTISSEPVSPSVASPNTHPSISTKTSILPKQTTSTQSSLTCDSKLWTHVYHPQRLKVIDSCKTVSGVIQSIKKEQDGDYHIQLKLDSQFSSLINSANVKSQHGFLVLEPVCQGTVTQSDAKSACANFKSTLTIPQKGSHVTVTGSYVLDLEHDSWAEIHPISSIKIIK
jgi:hypothetical protein